MFMIRTVYPRMVRQRILEGARKWIGPCDGLVFIRLRRKRRYFIFWRTRPPERQISSHLTTVTLWPLRSSLARIDDNRPSMWWRASTTTSFAHIPDPDTIFSALLLSVKPYASVSRIAARRNVCVVFRVKVFRVLYTGLKISWADSKTHFQISWADTQPKYIDKNKDYEYSLILIYIM